MKNAWIPAISAGLLLFASLFIGCGESSFEDGKKLFDEGRLELAQMRLEKVDKSDSNFSKSQEMLKEIQGKLEEKAEKECLDQGENFVKMLKESKTIDTWEKVMEDLKRFACRKLNTKPYIDRGYYNVIAYLSEWDMYPQAVAKYCEFVGCSPDDPRVLIKEEEITVTDENGKEAKEVIQQEIPLAHHETALKMFAWLVDKDMKNARWFDRYAKFMYDTERYKKALEAYEAIAAMENIGYEVKSRAKLTVDHLKKGKYRKPKTEESPIFFFAEEAKIKSRLKALKKDLDKARLDAELNKGAK